MTGNITIHSAEWTVMCGHIEFSLNFRREKYKLTISDGMVLSRLDIEDHNRNVSREDVLDLIRQGDTQMWNWGNFMATWTGFAAGFKAGKEKERESQKEKESQA